MSKTQKIIELMQDYQLRVDNDDNPDVDPYEYGSTNHWVRRNYRLYIGGSYSYPGNEPGYKHYNRNYLYIKENKDNKKKMRSFVISEFCGMLSIEFDCSYSTAQRAIVKSLSKHQLEALNQELIDDALEMIEGL